MLPPSISPIISVADASRTSRAGAKAAGLSRLVAAGFAVPEAFVIGTDCYRYHLWKSGTRELAAAPADAEEREKIRDAILYTDIPSEVWEAVLGACERLDGECGIPELRLVVRASAVEGPSRLHFPGAYEAYLGIATPEELSVAIRRVWASLWGGKAAAYRARHERYWEPAMAVIVQRMVNAERLGSASTASIVTGDPTKVVVSSWPTSNPTDSTHREVDLRLAARTQQGTETEVAEQAILVEETFGGPVEIEWATESGRLQLLQARTLEGLPPFFPAEHPANHPGLGDWRRLTRQPISHLARSLLPVPNLRKPGGDIAVQINGYIYVSGVETVETAGAASRARETVAAAETLREWNTRASTRLRDQIDEVMGTKASSLDQAGLRRLLALAAGAFRNARGWLLRISPFCRQLLDLLRDLLSSVPDMDDLEAALQRLMAGIESPAFMLNARIRDLGDRLSVAWDSGRIDDERWRHDLARSAWLLAREYGGWFGSPLEMHDIACWRGWLENPDTLWRAIEAATARDGGTTIVTRHFAARVAAIEEAAGIADRLRGTARKRFARLVSLARDCSALHDEAESICTLASAALRAVLAELARRMTDAGLIVERCDIFYLSLDELLAASPKPSTAECAAMRAKIAGRKHSLWLERRLGAPDVIPGQAKAHSR
jgi:hypothetical protein